MHTSFKAFFQLAYELIKIVKWFLSGSKSLIRVYAEEGKITTPSIQHAIKEKQKAFNEIFLTLTSCYEQKCTDKHSFIQPDLKLKLQKINKNRTWLCTGGTKGEGGKSHSQQQANQRNSHELQRGRLVVAVLPFIHNPLVYMATSEVRCAMLILITKPALKQANIFTSMHWLQYL